MRTIFFISLFFLSVTALKGQQVLPSERETIEVIKKFRTSTISFGIEKFQRFRNINGNVISKKVYSPIGTGVCFYLMKDSFFLPCIITAKHVIYQPSQSWDLDTVNIRFSEADTLEIDSYFGVKLPLKYQGKRIWFPHPDSTVDLACIVLDPYYQWPITNWPILPYSSFATREDYFEGKEVFVLGYPGAVGIDLLNKAFLRKGIIGYVPANFKNSNSKILIDCNIFPGNSGGPVFSVSQNAGEILSDTVFQLPRFYGIVSERRFSENKISYGGGILIDNKGNPAISVESTAIGVIITADKVKELLFHVKKEIDAMK